MSVACLLILRILYILSSMNFYVAFGEAGFPVLIKILIIAGKLVRLYSFISKFLALSMKAFSVAGMVSL